MGSGFLVCASRRRAVFPILFPECCFGAFLARPLYASGEIRRDLTGLQKNQRVHYDSTLAVCVGSLASTLRAPKEDN